MITKNTWRNWPWPLGDLAVPKPEHFDKSFISSQTMLRLASDRLRDAAAEHNSRNLDAVHERAQDVSPPPCGKAT